MVLGRFGDPKGLNTHDGKGINSGNGRADYTAIPYAATINMGKPSRKAFKHFFDFAVLTGALTINFDDVTMFEEGDEIQLNIVVDGTGRTVTWGTNVRAAVAATFAMTASQVGVVKAVFLNAKVHILSQTAGAA